MTTAAALVLSVLYSKPLSRIHDGTWLLVMQGLRRKNFKRVKSVVESKLFAARPTFAAVLREVQSAVSELRSVNLAWANPNHMYTLQVNGQAAGNSQRSAITAMSSAVMPVTWLCLEYHSSSFLEVRKVIMLSILVIFGHLAMHVVLAAALAVLSCRSMGSCRQQHGSRRLNLLWTAL